MDAVVAALVFAAWLILYGPTFWDLLNGIWAHEEHSYGPVILAAAVWLAWNERHQLTANGTARPQVGVGAALVVIALMAYAIGRSQDILIFEVGSQIPLLIGALLMFVGRPAVRQLLIPLLLLIFVVPLPGDVVAAVTAPLKSAVSAVATQVMYLAGYPIARTGVMLSVGQYQLLVADACAGLTSMFTLEAMGLIYMKLMGYTSPLRNTLLAISLVPVAFFANVIRVIVLVLITYHFGDEAGQGFVHSAAGIVLFVVATLLMLVVDSMLGAVLKLTGSASPKPTARARTT